MATITYRTAPLFSEILPPVPWSYGIGPVDAYHHASLAEACEGIPDRAPNDARHTTAWKTDRDNWHGSPNMAAALRMARYGWPEGAERAKRLRDGLAATIPQAPRLVRYDVAGQVPDVRRALAGNPMAMRRTSPAPAAQRPTITLVSFYTTPAGVDPSALEANAVAFAALSDTLESAGFRCELIAYSNGTLIGRGFEHAVRIKAPSDPLNIDAVAFGMGHPSLARRIGFALRTFSPDYSRILDGGPIGSGVELRSHPDAGVFIAPIPRNGETPARRFLALCSKFRNEGCPGIPAAEDLAHLSA